MTNLQKVYGIAQGVQGMQPPPIVAQGSPAATNIKFPLGQIWINEVDGLSFILSKVAAGVATWNLMAPGASEVDTVSGDSGGARPPSAGNIVIAGGTNITSAGAASTITINLDDAITLATSVTSPIYTAAAGMAINAAAGADIVMKMGDAAGANKISFVDSASVEVGSIDSDGAMTFSAQTFTGLLTANASALIQTAGTALNLGSDNDAAAVNIGVGTVARAISIGTSAAAHTVAIGNAAAGAVAIDTAAGISLDSATASNFTVTGAADLTMSSSAGSINIAGGEAAADAINIDAAAGGMDVNVALEMNLDSAQAAAAAVRIVASDAAGGIDIDAGTAGIAVDSTGAISLDGAASSNFSVSGGGIDLSLISAGGQVIVNAEEAVANAIRLLSAAGGLDANVALSMNLDSSQAAADAVRIVASNAAGGIDIDAGTAGINALSGGVFDLDSAGAMSINSSAAAINIGNDAVAQGINIGTGAAARTITIGNATGATALAFTAGTGRMTFTGTVKEIDADFLFSSGTDLTITQSPIMQSSATTGVAPVGTTGAVNLMYLQDGCIMEQFIIGAGQTIICPRMGTSGLDISLDQVSTEGAEYNFGARNNAKHAYTIGTSAAFFVEAKFFVEDLSGCAPLVVGFRKVEANNGVLADYTDYAAIGLNTATSGTNVVMLTELNAGGQTATNSTDAWGGDSTVKTVRVNVSAAGVVTFLIDGVAPTVTVAYTFDNADVVMPFIHFVNGADLAGVVGLQSFKCGFQA